MNYKDAEFYTIGREEVEIEYAKRICDLEFFKDVKPNYYIVLFVDGFCGIYNCERKKFLKPNHNKNDKNDYFSLQIPKMDESKYRAKVHRIICSAFKKRDINKHTVDHIDFDKLNNHLDNLEWCSMEENYRRAYKAKRMFGERDKVPKRTENYSKLELSYNSSRVRSNFKMNYDIVSKIFDLLEEGKRMTDIAAEIGVSIPTISQIKKGKRWAEHPRSIEFRNKHDVSEKYMPKNRRKPIRPN